MKVVKSNWQDVDVERGHWNPGEKCGESWVSDTKSEETFFHVLKPSEVNASRIETEVSSKTVPDTQRE
ncbi:MAG: hypothetical protein LCH34_10275 [Firmicutes bacterium]|nr:hypothetical protein [Bacillota bacterium]